jgi:exodeoxyribonuclease VII large subunit
MRDILTVTELNRTVNALLTTHPALSHVRVRGELTTVKRYPSGHTYFNLKDRQSTVSCVLFRQDAANAPRDMRDGMQVVVDGRPNIYDKTGRYQIIVNAIEEEGVGNLHQRFIELKERLAKEGLFDAKRKRPIPFLPKRLVVVTSPAGAVIRDIVNVTRRRMPGARLILVPVPVQGTTAAPAIAAAIAMANDLRLGDVMIVGRGGGSMDDLQPFNEEIVARAMARSAIPIVSAVGHETDFTIADFVADLRAPTPSAAAELVWPEKAQLFLRIDQLSAAMERRMMMLLTYWEHRLHALTGRPVLQRPDAAIDASAERLARLNERMMRAARRRRETETLRVPRLEERLMRVMRAAVDVGCHRVERADGALHALSPLSVLARGYAGVVDEQGAFVTRADRLTKDMNVTLKFEDGDVGARITAPAETSPRTKEGSSS